jgi:hypothetical protein
VVAELATEVVLPHCWYTVKHPSAKGVIEINVASKKRSHNMGKKVLMTIFRKKLGILSFKNIFSLKIMIREISRLSRFII